MLRRKVRAESHHIDRSVDLQVITAAGMGINNESTATKVGGYRLRVDGYNNASNGINMDKVRGYWRGVSTPSDVSDLVANAYPDGTVGSYSTINIGATHDLYLAKPASGDQTFWNNRGQKILIHDRKKL